ncbi:MAG: hypothetical protein FWD47_13205, partial [Treponema sp.]|nr:hypothetical protein [Treponema sp.]
MKFVISIGLITLFSISVYAQTQSIQPIPENARTIGNARIDIRQGNFSENGQSDVFSFIAPRDGRYRFEMAELRSNANVRLMAWNRLGENIADTSAGNGG